MSNIEAIDIAEAIKIQKMKQNTLLRGSNLLTLV